MGVFLGVVAAAADGVQGLRPGLVEPALARGWRVGVTLTPTAAAWLGDLGELTPLERLTGLPVRSTPRLPREPRPHPQPDCWIVAPASANTVAKLAMGIADNQAVTQVCEAIGTADVPVVVFPRVNAAHARHPAWTSHVATLRGAGVVVLDDPDLWPLLEPRAEQPGRKPPWETILGTVGKLLDRRASGGDD